MTRRGSSCPLPPRKARPTANWAAIGENATPAIPADVDKMKQRSPYYQIDAIRRPVLIVYGAHDARVQCAQSEKMIEALAAAHKDVRSLKLNDEGHLITRWPSNLKMYRRIEDFLAGCLGGRSSGFDYYELGAWAF